MGKFVNLKKRSFLLPPGMKDLIDMLRPKRIGEPQRTGSTPPDPVSRHSEILVIPLGGVAALVALFLRPGPETRLFNIRAPELALELHLCRDEQSASSCHVIFPDESEWEARIREIFGALGLQQRLESSFPPAVMFPGVPVKCIWDVVPLPTGQDALADLIRLMFERGCQLKQDSVVECMRLETEYPASSPCILPPLRGSND